MSFVIFAMNFKLFVTVHVLWNSGRYKSLRKKILSLPIVATVKNWLPDAAFFYFFYSYHSLPVHVTVCRLRKVQELVYCFVNIPKCCHIWWAVLKKNRFTIDVCHGWNNWPWMEQFAMDLPWMKQFAVDVFLQCR